MAPISRPLTSCSILPSAVRKTTGMSLVKGVGLEALADLVAVHGRHHDVEQDKVRVFSGPEIQCLAAVGGTDDVALRAQDGLDEIDVETLVVDHQDGLFALGHQASTMLCRPELPPTGIRAQALSTAN